MGARGTVEPSCGPRLNTNPRAPTPHWNPGIWMGKAVPPGPVAG